MKIVMLSTTADCGGAAIACKRLWGALKNTGQAEVKLIVRSATSTEESVYVLDRTCWGKWKNLFHFVWERLVIWCCNCFSRRHLFAVSIANAGTDVSELPDIQQADIIHLHWINQGFLSLKGIRKLLDLGKPVVWTLHDMWPCTSICHYARECDHFTEGCRNCFYLRYPSSHDLSAGVWKKKDFLNDSGIHFVAVSSWLKDQVKRSALTHQVETIVIPNVLDLQLFYPREGTTLKQELNIPVTKKIIVFGATKVDAPLKGFDLLKDALRQLCREQNWKKEWMLLIFGDVHEKAEQVFGDLYCDYLYLGPIADINRLAELYTIADITAVPSHYETFGQVIIESMACGTPVVSFDSSGQTDIISHREDGYLAAYKDTKDFAEGIKWLLSEADYRKVAEKARHKVKDHYSEEVVAHQYLNFYQRLLKCGN